MIEISVFNQPWYDRRIGQEIGNHPEASPDAIAISRSLMVAGAFVAEAIAHAFEEQRDTETIQSALADAAAALERLAELQEPPR